MNSGLTVMSRIVFVFAAVLLLAGLGRAEAAIMITVDKNTQKLTVMVDGAQRYEWSVSTARRGYRTPNGTYKPEWLARKHFSRQYDWSPMPFSIFFNEGYAIHGSYELSRLGSPASHGCIRLNPKNAELLYALVKDRTDETTIVVTGDSPAKTIEARSAKKRHARTRAPQPAAPDHRADATWTWQMFPYSPTPTR